MNNVTITNMKLIDDEFSQKMVDRHTSPRRSTTNFTPGASSKRIVPRRRWLELVYAMPHLVLRREILRSFATTHNRLASYANPIWNIFVRLIQVSPYARSKQNSLSGLGRQQVAGMEKEWQGAMSTICKGATVHHPYWHSESEVLQNLQRTIQHSEQSPIEIVQIETGRKSASRDTEATAQPPAANHSSGPTFVPGRKTVRNKQKNIPYPIPASGDTGATAQTPAANHPSGTSDFITHIHSHYSSGPTFRNIFHSGPYPITIAQSVSREPVATTNHRLPVVAPLRSTVIHRPPAANNIAKNSTQKTYGTSYYFNSMNPKHTNANVSWVETTPTYHTYPEIEHIIHTQTEVIKETVVEKEVDSRPSEVTSQSATVDINRLTDQVYSSIERKLMIEKERRGLYG